MRLNELNYLELNTADETATRVGGGLDELNSILSATQKKINRFKTVCGSLGTLLKVRVSSRDNTPVHKPSADGPHEDSQFQEQTLTLEASHDDHLEASVLESKPVVHKKIDINEKMSSHLDKLDSMITKAERAEGSMQHQTKIMKKIISK
ncbi:uncharacterized protein [Fopius arisanus]|uniref:Uncharacterized protein isoform X2 n=1 Tax=Fopius arisanus TaxID=64838 RepID=A0A9R1TWN7_9HYME|nr:PREDICTED: uncharacterized protein LOC105263891 isoform X2 [Fopius arisanus]